MKKILFPTDFSDASRRALIYGAELVKETKAELDVIHVYNVPYADPSSVPFEYIQKMLDEKGEIVKEKLEDFIGLVDKKAVHSIKPVYGIFISKEITEYAEANGYELILMGTKGEHSRLEKLLGSVTTQTMMHAHCPVLAIPESAVYSGVKSIAYATDFLPSDEIAVAKLSEFAQQFEAKVHFVHINKETRKDVEQEFRIEHYPLTFSDFSVINDESIMHGLDTFLDENKVNMLAMFIPNRRLWERLFHPSFTRKMVYHSEIPLLVFHG
jgi:nucleotide-binding universal stress UspA family protein